MPELRLIDPDGYTVPGTVHTVTDDQVEAVTAYLRTEVANADADTWDGFGYDARDYRVA